MITYFWPGPGSSDVILQMAACASVKMVTIPSTRSLVAAIRRALAIAAHSASYASHIGLVAFPGGALLPGDGVASGTVFQARAVREHGQPQPVRAYGILFDSGLS